MTTESAKQDVNETLELLTFLTIVAKFIADKAKGGFKKRELFAILPLIDDAMEAFEGIEEIPAELADLDETESQQLAEKVKESLAEFFPEDADKFDKWIDCAFQLVTPISNLITALKAE
jgi:hypothetical protein